MKRLLQISLLILLGSFVAQLRAEPWPGPYMGESMAAMSAAPVPAIPHWMTLAWTASASTGETGYGPIGYWVYRGTASGQESGTPLNAVPLAVNCSGSSCVYNDHNVNIDTTYYYVVKAQDLTSGLYATASNEASALVVSHPYGLHLVPR
jgi:hypothetical protein